MAFQPHVLPGKDKTGTAVVVLCGVGSGRCRQTNGGRTGGASTDG